VICQSGDGSHTAANSNGRKTNYISIRTDSHAFRFQNAPWSKTVSAYWSFGPEICTLGQLILDCWFAVSERLCRPQVLYQFEGQQLQIRQSMYSQLIEVPPGPDTRRPTLGMISDLVRTVAALTAPEIVSGTSPTFARPWVDCEWFFYRTQASPLISRIATTISTSTLSKELHFLTKYPRYSVPQEIVEFHAINISRSCWTT